MQIIEVIESKVWSHTSGKTASIYGACPWLNDNDKPNWSIVSRGFTWRRDDGCIGLGRKPAATFEEAESVMLKINGESKS